MQANVFISCIISVLFGLSGILLIKKVMPDIGENEEKGSVPFILKSREKAQKIWIILMFLCNLAAVMRTSMLGDGICMTARSAALLTVLWVCAWFDMNCFLIPNRVLLVALIDRLIIFGIEMLSHAEELRYILSNCLIAAVAMLIAGIMCRLVSPGSLGFGDIKLMAVMGLYLGLERTWDAILGSMILIFLFSAFVLLTGRAKKESVVPFAPALLIGTWFSLILY